MSMHTPIDFIGLAGALLDRADQLVPMWLPAGHREGRYWYVGDFDGSEGKSANVNLKTGAWGDNGRPGDSGRDLISLYGRIHGVSNLVAARELMADAGWRVIEPTPPAVKKRRAASEWQPIHPVPDDAPPYRTQWAHYTRGVPPVHWEYRNQAGALLGLVVRFDASDGSKDVQPISYCQRGDGRREWRYKAFAGPRPLYGLWRLPAGHAGQVIITEGEKKADRLHEALGGLVPVLSWPGGCNTPQLADWSPLRGCHAVLWPDADAQREKPTPEKPVGDLLPLAKQPGHAAMRRVQALLAELGVPAQVVDVGPPGSRPDGWDAADAIAEGWTRVQLWDFMQRHVPDAPPSAAPAPPPAQPRPPAPPPAPPAAPAAAAARAGGGGGGQPPPPDDGVPDEDELGWRDEYIQGRTRGSVRECVPNVMLVLHRHAQWRGVLGFDEFSNRVVKRKPAPYDPPDLVGDDWTGIDDTRAAAWIARREGWVPAANMVAEAVEEVARSNPFHPVLDWLRTLKHDGVPRLDHWLSDLLMVEDSAYVRRVSRYYLIGMCARVLRPGCKFDTCLVLEGPQGKGKSTALSVLGGAWYSDTELDLGHKDAMSSIHGKWLHEFGEMGSLARAESSRQKSFLSRQVDEFRPVYGRRNIRCPRQLAFAGSTNEWAWNKDPTGGRRFWPVEVTGQINVDGLRAIREQLFAEAFAAAQAGERYWPDPEEQRELFDPEQLSRETPDALLEMLSEWMGDPVMMTRGEFTLADAGIDGLKLDAKSLTRDIQTRIGNALRKLGCERVERRNAAVRFVYRRPTRKAASSQNPEPVAMDGGDLPI